MIDDDLKIKSKTMLHEETKLVVEGLLFTSRIDKIKNAHIYQLISPHGLIQTKELPPHQRITICTSTRTKTYNFRYQLTEDVAEQSQKGFFARLRNSIFFLCSYGFYEKYSKIVYEGDEVSVFGLVSYNPFADRWEMPNPVAMIANQNISLGKKKLLYSLAGRIGKLQLVSSFQFLCLTFFGAITVAMVYQLYRRYFNRLFNFIKRDIPQKININHKFLQFN